MTDTERLNLNNPNERKMITIRLSPDMARLLFLNADGWLDAGACEGGLNEDERKALNATCDQILRGLKRQGLELKK